MRNALLYVLPIIAALWLAPCARADFLNLEVTLHTTVPTPMGDVNVYRLYARFSNGADRLLAWGGTAQHPAILKTRCGLSFFNHRLGQNTAPTNSAITQDPLTRWDTFATIGVNVWNQGSHPSGGDATQMSPNNLPQFIAANEYPGVFDVQVLPLLPYSNQGRADYANDGDPQLRVLMAQFTTPQDEGMWHGVTIGYLHWQSAGGQVFTQHDLFWGLLAESGRCCLAGGGCVFTTVGGSCLPENGHKFIGCEPCSVCGGCEGDIGPPGGDGVVGVPDLLTVISQWGPCGNCSGDFAPNGGDGHVGVPDLLAVISRWGPCE